MKLLFGIKDYKKRIYILNENHKKLNKIIKYITKELITSYKSGWNIRHFCFGHEIELCEFNAVYYQSVKDHFSSFSDVSIIERTIGDSMILEFSFREVK